MVKFSVGLTSQDSPLEIDGPFTQGSRPGRISGESVGRIFDLDSCDWSNGLQYHIFDIRLDTEFEGLSLSWNEDECKSLLRGDGWSLHLQRRQGLTDIARRVVQRVLNPRVLVLSSIL